MVEQSDHQTCQAKIHLGQIHLVYSIICLSFRRHFSTLHPLYDVFKYHCEGTVAHINTAMDRVMKAGNLYYAGGFAAYANLASQAYHERKFGEI